MKNRNNRKYWAPVFDDEGGEGGEENKGGEKNKSFTQDDINTLLAKERREYQKKMQSTAEELEMIRSKSKLTDADRKTLESRIESMRNEYLTKEELYKKEQDKLKNQHTKEVENLSKEAESWKSRFTSSSIDRAIIDACIHPEHEAYSTKQVVALLRPNTRLIEELNEAGEPTGVFLPKVKFEDADKHGTPVVLELSPKEAVKRMSEMEEYYNLFKEGGVGGVGRFTKKGGTDGKLDAAKLARENPAKYRQLRKEGKLKI